MSAQSQLESQTTDVISMLREIESAADTLNNAQSNPQDISGITLSNEELLAFHAGLQRAARGAYETGHSVLSDIYQRHRVEFLVGLKTFKKLKSKDFKGTEPTGGFGWIFGPEAAYFGKGRDWDSDYTPAAGSPANWIHSGSTQLGGSAGNAIRIGSDVLHVIVGYGVFSQDIPRTIKLIETINSARQPVINVTEQFKNNTLVSPVLKIRELENARWLKQGIEYSVQVQNRLAVPSSEWAVPIGVTFTTQTILLQTDLGNLSAANLNTLNILSTT